jgi:mRNA interferase YafQ
MLDIQITGQCKKDIKRCKKRGKDLNKLWTVVATLAREEDLDPKHNPHQLSGNWAGFWECHIEPDWLLIYHLSETTLTLVRTGSHSDLF